jgi:hypothetical protein
MHGLVPDIHVFLFPAEQDVDGRVKPGHDEYQSKKAPPGGEDRARPWCPVAIAPRCDEYLNDRYSGTRRFGPESILPMVVMDSGLVLRTPRNDGRLISPSLRANGSRERAPDDRLSEAIHLSARQVWIASSLSLLAMTNPSRGRPRK